MVVDFFAKRLIQQKNREKWGPINVGSQKSMTILEIAMLIQSRCRLTLGFEPELICNRQNVEARNTEMDYRIDRLQATGYRSTVDPMQEIDDLLTYCYH